MNSQLNKKYRQLVLERLLLCKGRPLNTELEAGPLEITVLRVSEIAPAILIMSPTLIPYVSWLKAEGPAERRLVRLPAPTSPISCPCSALLVPSNSPSLPNTIICFMSHSYTSMS